MLQPKHKAQAFYQIFIRNQIRKVQLRRNKEVLKSFGGALFKG